MVNLRSAIALGTGAAVICSATLFAQGERKLNDAEKKEFQAIVKVVDGPPASQPTANDVALSWVTTICSKRRATFVRAFQREHR